MKWHADLGFTPKLENDCKASANWMLEVRENGWKTDRERERQTSSWMKPSACQRWQHSQNWAALVLAEGEHGIGGEYTHSLCINWEDTCLIMGHCAVYLPHKRFTVDPQIAAGADRLCYIPMIQGQKNTVGSLIFMQLYYIRLLTCLHCSSQTECFCWISEWAQEGPDWSQHKHRHHL